jgi:hypothetical protein
MRHPDDPPLIDARRLARWMAGPSPRVRGRRDARATPQAVIAAHGGEVPFWLAWLRGELDADLQAWVRQQAEHDAELRDDLRRIEQQHGSGYSTRAAHAEVRDVLEAGNYLTESPGGGTSDVPHTLASFEGGEQTETDLLLSDQGVNRKESAGREANQGELRRRIRSGLFALLEEVEIHVPPAEEAREGTRLLEYVVGLPALSKFVQLQRLQQHSRCSHASLRDRLLQTLAPEFFAREGEGFRYRLSYRLFLRSRLQHFCRRRGWLPAGPRYRDLPTAFAALSRERIGTLLRGLLASREVFQAAGVPCQHLAALLETAP